MDIRTKKKAVTANRPAIPKDLKMRISVESRHRCAVCGGTSALEIAHIVPWKKCKRHEEKNLILLCATCHARADRGEIDRKALQYYKEHPWAITAGIDSRNTQRACVSAVLFDEGHGQHKWDLSERPLLGLDYTSLVEVSASLSLSVSGIQTLSLDALSSARVLVIVTPRDMTYSLEEIRSVQTFVRTGGSLLALSFYFGDVHHHTNLNELLESFGIMAKYDRVRDKKSSCETEFHLIAYGSPNNPILAEGERVYVPLSCSLALKPPATGILISGDDSILERPDVVIDGIARSFTVIGRGRQVLGAITTYGRGKVAVLGSWQVFTITSLEKQGFVNRQLLSNLLKWLMGGK